MIQIKQFEIKYFRSIYDVNVKDLKDVVVLAGRNDVGKSNIVKALNLFFNNQTDWSVGFDFNRDFSKLRLSEVRKETIKGRQFIKISIDFIRGPRYSQTLPEEFTVTRTWHRDSTLPETKSSLERQFKQGKVSTKHESRVLASLQRYLNSIKFEYIPAIKDSNFFSYILGNLQDVIFGRRSDESGIADAVQKLNRVVEKEANEIENEFKKVSGIHAQIRLPEELAELFRAFSVITKSGENEMPMNMRGDGIRSRFLPSLLHHLSYNSKFQYIWGFEEPENSLEHGLATKLAQDIVESYSKNTQVFMTSHSPAFFTLEKQNVSCYRVFPGNKGTVVQPVSKLLSGSTTPLLGLLEQELGLLEFQQKYQREYESRMQAIELQEKTLKDLRKQIDVEQRPVLLTEGKWDVTILKEAWERLNKGVLCPFRFLQCNPMDEALDKSAGGVGTLVSCLETHRYDEPVAVGLFDRDNEGFKKGFQSLNKNFTFLGSEDDFKIHQHGIAGAILLPIIPGRNDYGKYLNLVLEFYFDDEFLEEKVDGKGLVFFQPEITRYITNTGVPLGKEKTSDPSLRQIRPNSKKDFAEIVLPKLPVEAFRNFRFLFEKIQFAIDELGKTRKEAKKKL